jgi:hypothetical protein
MGSFSVNLPVRQVAVDVDGRADVVHAQVGIVVEGSISRSLFPPTFVPAFVPRTTGRRQETTRTVGASNLQVRAGFEHHRW